VKRFYKQAIASGSPDGCYAVLLDGKAVKTPKRALLLLPHLALVESIAGEWDSQDEDINPQTMPLTRLAFAAIDVVVPEREAVTEQLLNYARHDLLCYRAEGLPELTARQAQVWDPLLDWAAESYGARLNIGSGIRHVEQPLKSIVALEQAIARYGEFKLAALHAATTITGSLILALALAAERVKAEEAFAAATLDEVFQAEKWGRDMEAEQRRLRLHFELAAAARFLRLLEA